MCSRTPVPICENDLFYSTVHRHLDFEVQSFTPRFAKEMEVNLSVISANLISVKACEI